MRAVDTNIVVRLFMADDDLKFAAAVRLFGEHRIRVPVTVLLETEWVLRRVYKLGQDVIADQFRRLGGLPDVEVEDSDRVALAIDMMEAGADFADALHLVRCTDCSDFVTFDKAFAAAAPDAVTLLTA